MFVMSRSVVARPVAYIVSASLCTLRKPRRMRKRLGGDHGSLLLGNNGLVVLKLGAGSGREVLLLYRGGDRSGSRGGLGDSLGRSRAAADKLLGLGSVVTHVLLGNAGGLSSVLAGDAAELARLLIDDLAGLVQLGVDKLLVGGVDQRNAEESSGADEGKTPERNNFDEVVREEGADEGL